MHKDSKILLVTDGAQNLALRGVSLDEIFVGQSRSFEKRQNSFVIISREGLRCAVNAGLQCHQLELDASEDDENVVREGSELIHRRKVACVNLFFDFNFARVKTDKAYRFQK